MKNEPRQADNNESVFAIVERLVKSIRIIAEMQKIGDADQVRQYELAKVLLAYIVNLAEGVNQSLLDLDDTAATREGFLVELAQIISSQQDLLSAEATSIYDRQVNSELMDIYADENATAMFITRNLLAYGCNHGPTVRAFFDKVNLEVVSQVAQNMNEIRVRQLIEAIYDGIAR